MTIIPSKEYGFTMPSLHPLLILLFLLIGCAPPNGLSLARVQGTVTYQGEALDTGDLIFTPDASKGSAGPSAMGTLDEDGNFELSTESADDGAIVGFHRVGIAGYEMPESADSPALGVSPVDKSALKAMVLETKKKKARTKTKSKSRAKGTKPAQEIARGRQLLKLITPEKLAKPATSGIGVEIKPGNNVIRFEIDANGLVTIK